MASRHTRLHPAPQSPAKETNDNPSPCSPSNLDLKRDIAELSSKVLTKLDNINTQITSLNHRINEVETSVEFNSAKIVEIEKSVPAETAALREEISNLKEKILLAEIHSRKSNLLFYGVKETQNENIYETLREVFLTLGVDELKAKEIQLVNAHRLPRRSTGLNAESQAGEPNPPTPIIAKFVKMPDRDLILTTFENTKRASSIQQPVGATESATKQPAPHRITVRSDLPPTLKARRGQLAETAFKLRKEKNLSTRIKLQGVKIILQCKEKGTTTWKSYDE